MTWGKFHKGSGTQAGLSRMHRIWVGKSMTTDRNKQII